MDSTYDVPQIREYSLSLGHIPIININPRRKTELKIEIQEESKREKAIGFQYPEGGRYNERISVERVNGRLKDEFGGRMVRVKAAQKVICHLMFGILALTADQLMRFAV